MNKFAQNLIFGAAKAATRQVAGHIRAPLPNPRLRTPLPNPRLNAIANPAQPLKPIVPPRPVAAATPKAPPAPAASGQSMVFRAAPTSFGQEIAATAKNAIGTTRASAAGIGHAMQGRTLPLGYHPKYHPKAEVNAYNNSFNNARFAVKNPGFAVAQASMGVRRAFDSPMGRLATSVVMPG